MSVLATRFASEFSRYKSLLDREGAGKTGRRLAPMVRVQQKARGRTTGAAENTRPSLRDGLTAYFALSLVHRACWPPSPARHSKHRRRLDTSIGISGPRDFTVRTTSFV